MLVRTAQELQPADLAGLVEVFEIEELARVDRRFHHHVDLAGLLFQAHDLLALLGLERHGHRAGHVFARLERLNAHPAVALQIGVDVHRVDVGILEHLVKVGIALGNVKLVGKGVELGRIPAADRHALRLVPRLVDRHKLRAKPKSNHCHTYFVHRISSLY